jgi:type VI secretion system protein ImpG
MRDELLGYYERELTFLRQMGADFAQKYPKIASRLLLESDKCEDPHVERMIEAFAFLAGRIHLKIDDEFPEITESFLNVLYPHYLAPIPSMSIVQFGLDPEQGKLTTGYPIKRGTTLYSRPIKGTPCRFRTCYPTVAWPLDITSASLESLDPVDTRGKWSEAVIKISVKCLNNTTLAQLKIGEVDGSGEPIKELRFYLNGEPQLTYPLYEYIFNNTKRIELRATDTAKGATRRTKPVITLPPSSIKPVGFEPEDGMLSYTARSFLGYRLLTEYFTFPEKFLFFDITGLDQAAKAGFTDQFDILIYLSDITPPRAPVNNSTFQLGCTPIINLFSKVAEPIHLTSKQVEYRVVPDVHRQLTTEVYSIDSVVSIDPFKQQTRDFQPFYSFRHSQERDQNRTFWYATRKQSQIENDEGTEVYLSLVDLGFNPNTPPVETLTLHVTCTNRDLPGDLPFGSREGDFEIEGTVPISRVRCLKKPTETVRPPLRRATQWRLISHLTLNHFSIVSGDKGSATEALQEILVLYDFMDSQATRRQISGITNVSSRRVTKQTGSRIGAGFVRGIETTIEFDEQQFVGSGVYLFASVLERFLGLYVSINSFSQLVAKTVQREDILKRWSPRAGSQILL